MYYLAPIQPTDPYIAAFDCETFLIRPGLLIPKLVCLSYADHKEVGLLAREDGLDWLEEQLHRNTILLTHNGPYDFAVCVARRPHLLPLVFKAYEEGRARDTRIRQKLRDISKGEHKFHWDQRKADAGEPGRQKTGYALDQLVWRHFGHVLPKGPVRLRFAEMDGRPISEYPEDFSTYAKDDSVWTRRVHLSQDTFVTTDPNETVPYMPNELPQTCAAWALHLMSAWGLRTNKAASYALRDKYKALHDAAWERLQVWGMVRKDGAKAGSKDMAVIRAAIEACYVSRGIQVPLTAGGDISTDADCLAEIVMHDADFEALEKSETPPAEWPPEARVTVLDNVGEAEHTLTSFVPIVLQGVDRPINPGFNALVETGRSSCEKPNLHNPPRKGGVRECFEPRPGNVFIDADYDTIELRTLAQCCLIILGESSMAEAIKRGEDLHASFGADLMGLDYAAFDALMKDGDKAAEDMRQLAKPGNFGFPGGMGGTAFAAYARGYGVKITTKEGLALQKAWLKKWPEMVRYFRHATAITAHGDGTVTQLLSERVRGGLRFTQACNTYFQGLAADGVKDATWHVTKECYLGVTAEGKPSPLAGCRPVVVLHDELILEAPSDDRRPELASNAARRLKEVMEARMQVWIPDVPAKASAVMFRRWYKGAKAVFNADGHMLPSKPVKVVIDGKEKTKWVADI
jgi:hypothetical protein